MRGSAEFWPDDAVKSISLADMSAPSPPAPARRPLAAAFPSLGRMVDILKIALRAWGAISLGAVAGMSAFYLSGATPAPLLAAASTRPASASPASAASPADRLAALIDAPLPPTMTAPPFSLKPPAATSAQSSMLLPAASEPGLIAEARLPRPRPEDAIITGSIAPSAERDWRPRPHRSALDPCNALQNLGAPILFGNRCGPSAPVYPASPHAFDRVTVRPAPPAGDDAPRPYQPPVVYQE